MHKIGNVNKVCVIYHDLSIENEKVDWHYKHDLNELVLNKISN